MIKYKSLAEVKQAILNGTTVYWSNENQKIILCQDSLSQSPEFENGLAIEFQHNFKIYAITEAMVVHCYSEE